MKQFTQTYASLSLLVLLLVQSLTLFSNPSFSVSYLSHSTNSVNHFLSTHHHTDSPIYCYLQTTGAPEENSSEDDESEDGCTDYIKDTGCREWIAYSIAESTLFHFSSTFQKRAAIPLFVLYHSWKSFAV